MTQTKLHAHRGASHEAPENTWAAFHLALAQRADFIELDIHQSKDGHLVIMHDETLNRTSNGSGLIKEKTLDELLSLDCGQWFSEKFKGQQMPLLEEVLPWAQKEGLSLNIELKAGSRFYPHIEKKLLSLIVQHHMKERVIVSSFDHHALQLLKSLDEEIKTGILYTAALVDPWDYAQKIKADALHPLYLTVDETLLRGAFSKGLWVNPYTVDDPAVMKQLIKAGVSAIITNEPNVFHQVKQSM